MRVTILASGSGGNALLVESSGARVLVDAGLPAPTLARRMARVGHRAGPQAVLVTHAHGDHHRYAVDAALRFRAPVWVSDATRPMLALSGAPSVRVFGTREPFRIGDLTVRPLPVPHDAAQVALRFEDDAGQSVALATDLGEVSDALVAHLRGADLVLLESNHDLDMLWRGPYSNALKRRIASPRGHLSNEATASALGRLDARTRTVVLMHLSATNNTPRAALDRAAEALADLPAKLLAASQEEPLAIDLAPPAQLPLFHAP
jgi:phosphoribosyl 1,2-cyclic phosphodiesterase